MARVLYLSYDGMTDPLGQSQVIPYLEGLSKKGFDITLLSCEKKIPYQKYREEIAEQLKNAGIKWEIVRYSKKPPVLSTLYDLLKINRKAYKLHKKEEFQIIHCRSYITAFVGMWMKRKYGTRFLFDMRGFWADERVEGGIWNLENPVNKTIYNFFKKKEKEFLEEADYTITLTHKAKEIIHSWPAIRNNPVPITVIPCCVDLDLFDPYKIEENRQEEIRRKIGIERGDFILLYLGSVGTWYLLNEMLAFFKALKGYEPNAKFLFVTKEPKELIIKAAEKTEVRETDLLVTSALRKDVPLLISISTACIYFIKPSFSKQASSPTKHGEMLAMGKSIITNSGVGDSSILKNNELVWTVDQLSEKSYLSLLNSCFISLAKTRVRETKDLGYFSLYNGIEELSALYKRLKL